MLIGDYDDAVVFDWDPELTAGAVTRPARAARTGVWKDDAVHDPSGHAADRPDIAGSPRTVVKIGSSSLTTKNGAIDDARIAALTGAIAARANGGHQVLLVSSGAIATGMAPLGLKKRPKDLATQQAAASVGQGLFIARYTQAFNEHGLGVGQVLLTADDLMRRGHYRNAQRTLTACLNSGSSRSSTRTTRWPPRRSASATTTGWPPWSPTSAGPAPSSCSPTWTAFTTAIREGAAPGSST